MQCMGSPRLSGLSVSRSVFLGVCVCVCVDGELLAVWSIHHPITPSSICLRPRPTTTA